MNELFLIFILVAVFALLGGLAWVSWFLTGFMEDSPSPYTGKKLRRAESLPFKTMYTVRKYMDDNEDSINRPFSFRTAAFCRETGRIFEKAVRWNGVIRVNWDFLKKKYPGEYVSWGSLTKEEQKKLIKQYGDLNGFQTEASSKKRKPKDVEEEYIYLKPGPLYVNKSYNLVVGWKCIPDTDIEVLIVQRPKILI